MKMELSKSVDKKTHGYDTLVCRNSLFYSKYKYRARLHIPSINRTWGVTTLNQFKNKMVDLSNDPWRGSYDHIKKEIDMVDYDAIDKWLRWRGKKHKQEFKIRIEGETAAVFTNDLSLLHQLYSIRGEDAVDITCIDISAPMGVKYFAKEPPAKFRTYFKNRRVDLSLHETMKEFFDTYENTDSKFQESPSLLRWTLGLCPSYYRTTLAESYFVDYDHEESLLLLAMSFGQYVGKTYRLEQRPDK